MSASHAAKQTARTWYQNKRLPLYFVVGGTFASGVTFLLYNRASHPSVESNKAIRGNETQEVENGGPMSLHAEAGAGHGASTQGSKMRHTMRGTGMMEGQATSGIFPNEAIAEKMRDVMGAEHPEHAEVLKNKEKK